MKYSLFYFLLSCLLFSACNPNRIFEKHLKDFPGYRWDADRSIDFMVDFSDTTSTYDIYFAFRHISGWQFKFMDISMEILSPTSVSLKNNYSVKVMDNSGNYLSKCAGDLCDFEQVIEKGYQFDCPGKYTFKFQQKMPIDPLPNIMEVGLIIKKSKLDN